MISTLPTTLMQEQLPTPTSATPTNYPSVTLTTQLRPKICWLELTISLLVMLKYITLLVVRSS